jgi:hypothetical protein
VSPSWCETNLPHASIFTPSMIEPSAFGCWDKLDRFRYSALTALVIDCAAPIYVDRRMSPLAPHERC